MDTWVSLSFFLKIREVENMNETNHSKSWTYQVSKPLRLPQRI